jgi:hypothetical protein
MPQPTVAELLAFASSLEGERLPTLAGRASFTLRVVGAGIEFVPISTGKRRFVTREMIRRVLDEYASSRSLTAGHYQSITFDASYLLAIISRYDRRNA